MNPNSFFVGDVVRLSGKTRHGKNRVRENGEFWEIITVDGGESSILSTKICHFFLSLFFQYFFVHLYVTLLLFHCRS